MRHVKVSITIPDWLAEQAERAAQELSLSKSQFYANAVEAFVRCCCQSDITDKLNEVYDKESSSLDPVLAEMQWRSIFPKSW